MSILSFEEPYTDNEVVGYYEDKLIVKREDGKLFFCEIPENLIEIGETISPKDLTSISELPYDVQKEIKNQYADWEV
mgnify:FL=1